MELQIEYLPIDQIKPYDKNAREHREGDVQAIVNSIMEFGFDDPIGIWSDENIIVEGHGRLEAAKQLDIKEVPVIRLDHLTDEQRRAYALAHNKTAELSDWDFELLTGELDNIFDIDMADFGFEFGDIDNLTEPEHANLSEKFGVPPFSVLDTKQGYWQERKKTWKKMGLKSDEGRDAECLQQSFGKSYGRELQTGTSIFDPVLCEIMYRWFCPRGGYNIRLFRRGLRPWYCSF